MTKRWIGVLAAAGLAASAAGSAMAADLVFLSDNVPTNLNVDGAGGTVPASYGGQNQVLEGLIGYTPKGKNAEGLGVLDFTKYQPKLAESWTFDPQTFTYTFKLRRNVVGCAGETFNADDVLYTFARAKSVSGAAAIGYFLTNLGSVKSFHQPVGGMLAARNAANEARRENRPAPSPDPRDLGDEVKKIDDYTVAIRQEIPNRLFLAVLPIFGLNIYDKEKMMEKATPDDPWSHTYANTTGVFGFGPYCVQEWKKDESITLTANPRYYAGKPEFDRIIWRKVPQASSRLSSLQTGAADVIESVTFKDFQALKRIRGVKVGGEYVNTTAVMIMNWRTAPFDNIRLRQAVAHAIPYDRIIKDVYFGDAKKYEGGIPSAYPGYHKARTQYAYNPERAKQLLAEAGFPGGKGLEEFKDAFKIHFVVERESIVGPTATIIRTALRDIGLPVELEPMPQQQFADRQLVKKDLPMAIIDTSKPIGIDAAYAVALNFLTPEKGGLNNFMRYSNPKVDALFEQAKSEVDVTKQNALLVEIQETFMFEVGWVPLVEYKTQFAWRESKVDGITLHSDGNVRFVDFKVKR